MRCYFRKDIFSDANSVRTREQVYDENLAFVSDLLKGTPEKDSRKKLLTILPFMMYIYIEKTQFDETNALVDRLKACTNATPYSASICTQQCIYIK